MPTLYEYLDSITVNKKDLQINEAAVKDYPAFIINRALSMGMDTVLAANEMNKLPKISKRMHYDFLRSAVRPGKRFNKWAKNIKHDYAPYVIEYYTIGKREAMQYIEALTLEQLDAIKFKVRKGGSINDT